MHRLFYCLCLLLVCVRSQNIHNIENLLDKFVSDEVNLWKIINYHKNDATRTEDVSTVLEFYEVYMDVDLGEIGIFQMISKEWLNDYAAYELIKHIATVNSTLIQALKLVKAKSYADILKFVNELPRMIELYYITFLLEHTEVNFWTLVQNTSRICDINTKYVLAESQVLREVYKEILAHFLKSYILLQFTYAITATSTENVGYIFSDRERRNFRSSVNEFKRSLFNYESYDFPYYKLKPKNFSREMWACDPNDFKLQMEQKDSFVEVPISYQGFISNEMNLNSNRNCRQSCSDYTSTRQYICADTSSSSCRVSVGKELLCHGSVQNCITIQDDVTICIAPANSSRRYDFIKFDGGKIIGTEKHCSRKLNLISHWNGFYKCDNCLCYCNENDNTSNDGRHFSLRDVTSDIEQNLIVTGVGITKVNRVIQLTILQQKLLPNGVLNITKDQTNSIWITSPALNMSDDQITLIENKDYASITWQNRSIALTSVTIRDNDHVVTGVRFRKQDGHIKVEIRATRYNFERGRLMDVENSFWMGNDNLLNELELDRPDVPTKSEEKSQMIAEKNQFIKFQPSAMEKDAAQTTAPYLDTATVNAFLPLSGIGLYYKSNPGYGGFIAPKLISFDFGRIRPI